MSERIYFYLIIFSQKEMGSKKHTADVVVHDMGFIFTWSFYHKKKWRAEELLLKHEDDELVLTIVSVENFHIHWVLTSTVVDTNSSDMMEMYWCG
jgi:hypothetical protein